MCTSPVLVLNLCSPPVLGVMVGCTVFFFVPSATLNDPLRALFFILILFLHPSRFAYFFKNLLFVLNVSEVGLPSTYVS